MVQIKNVKAIFFDLGGTLVDVHKLRKNIEFYLNIFKKCGLTIGKKEFTHARKEVEKKIKFKDGDKSGVFFKTLFRELNLKIPHEVVIALQHLYRENIIQKAPLKPKCKFVLSKLKKRYILGIISDTNAFYGYKWLRRWGLKKYFDLVLFTEDIASCKEQFKPFIYVLEKMKLKPNECVVVGDNELKDIRPAKKIGIITVKVMEDREKSSADFKIKELGELLKIFM